MNRFLATLLIFILFFSCKENNKISIVENYIIDLGFIPSRGFRTIYFDSIKQEDLLAIVDKNGSNKIKIYKLKGELVKTISLNSALDSLQSIGTINYFNHDTIIIHSNNTNKFALINSYGNVMRFFDLNEIIPKSVSDNYNYYGISNEIGNLNSYYLGCDFNFNGKDIALNNIPTDPYKLKEYEYKKIINTPYILKISDFLSDSVKFSHLLYGFEKRYANEKAFYLSGPSFIVQNQYYIFYSIHNNQLYKANSKTMFANDSIAIKSKYGKIGMPGMRLTKYNMQNWEKVDKQNVYNSNYIVSVLHNVPTSEYYFIIYLKDKSEKGFTKRKFSVLITDSNFKTKSEHLFDDGVYHGGSALMTRQGLILQKNDLKNEKRITYCLFKFK